MAHSLVHRQCTFSAASTSGRPSVANQVTLRLDRHVLRPVPSPKWYNEANEAASTSSRLSVVAAATPIDEAKKGRGRPKKLKDTMDTSPNVVEEGAPPLPKPGEFQQTLVKSFTLGGIGLHSGEYAYIRVRPAYAGEGRYFVRVPEGTNSDMFELEEPENIDLSRFEVEEEPDEELEALKLQLFQDYLSVQELEEFTGTFPQYLLALELNAKGDAVKSSNAKRVLKSYAKAVDLSKEWLGDGPEPIVPRGEDFLPASVEAAPDEMQAITTRLGNDEDEEIGGVELLLSALEACGVDNARIEIEGGAEIPIIDGSALGWVMEIQYAGLRPAPLPGSPEPVRRMAMRPTRPITVQDEDSFITLYPEETIRITVGIDHSEDAEVIGKQWKSWCMFEDLHYRFELADARTFVSCPEELVSLRELGFVKGGSEGCILVAFGDRWWDPQMLRHVDDEPARHTMVDLIGDLSLNAQNGHCGLPIGHIVAYKPNHDLNVHFVRALREAVSDEDYVPMVELGAADQEAAEQLLEELGGLPEEYQDAYAEEEEEE
eukprot:CAMPEP_0202901626 /NCGR_PEP_ID=MMETSP1392-20130828/14362_1 /ASSEMBLY_ACC=CAM_ASM_000868 /TAXON_ID=225041 /ORGANISM="Chlamydomonas chlamydogama, Strain SAG 11-48b" /LENGTH=544 /DNA_ID=CAMNT_0049588215 /DNA_START=73 /DNA_END=1704 /DNA_ORIENTATION=+